ncbi:hypothetical protein PRIPAC_93670 [Pristionchus pacificus]|uniref:Uncharacterized protein n=1 Tax=Pristionchus pacificus TaxID=54126 RepID=A0A2A6BAK9_PRIPA|nr:hypothetical protein PRIPAC_93670 [Pristionchus pacificus]|eukprot:PDM62904.1 hypothetical protein PRIPAC_50119 [Pristionchus pacificus]
MFLKGKSDRGCISSLLPSLFTSFSILNVERTSGVRPLYLCDIQFCICLQDAADNAKSDICEPVTTQACALVQTMRNVFPVGASFTSSSFIHLRIPATPPDHSKDYINFPD